MNNSSGTGRRAGLDAAVEDTLRQAAVALQEGRAKEAESITHQVLARRRDHPGALQLLGMTLLAQERPEAAVAPLEGALRSRPGAAVETYLAVALRKTGRSGEALALLQRASERQPMFPQALYELGMLLYEQRQVAEAQTALERGMQVATRTDAFSLALGNIHLRRGEANKAESAFARVVANAPNHGGALCGLGCALMGRGEFNRAAERFRRAIASDPTDVRLRLLLASCLFELSKPEEAIATLRALVQATPQAFGDTLKACAGTGRGRLWLRPSAAAAYLRSNKGG
jgi:predicted Zn-dependent protease